MDNGFDDVNCSGVGYKEYYIVVDWEKDREEVEGI